MKLNLTAGGINRMGICYDFQKWNIVTLSLVLAVNLIGLGILLLK